MVKKVWEVGAKLKMECARKEAMEEYKTGKFEIEEHAGG